MKKEFYLKGMLRAILVAIVAMAAFITVSAQEYADTTNLIADIEAGLYEEYILAPASANDTFKLSRTIYPAGSFVLKAKDGLGFMPLVTGNTEDRPSQFFRMAEIDGGADVEVTGIKFIGSIDGEKAVSDGLMRILTENINLVVKDCEFYDFLGYNTIAKVYNSGGDITIDNVLMVNTAGKIVQVNYKDDDATPNYVPKMGDLTVTNTSIIDNYKRIFFELGAGDVPIDENDPNIKQRFNAGAENVTIDHCTFFRHSGVNVMQGRSEYEFGGTAAIEGTLSITNSIFSSMDENLNADSASQVVMDYNLFDFGVALLPEEIDDLNELWSPTNTVTTVPVFADTASGAWDLTLQNPADILGSGGNPIGDPRWWGDWDPVGLQQALETSIGKVYSYRDQAIVETTELSMGSVNVYSITGQMVKSLELDAQRTEIRLPQGFYVIRVNTEMGSMTGKVLIIE